MVALDGERASTTGVPGGPVHLSFCSDSEHTVPSLSLCLKSGAIRPRVESKPWVEPARPAPHLLQVGLAGPHSGIAGHIVVGSE